MKNKIVILSILLLIIVIFNTKLTNMDDVISTSNNATMNGNINLNLDLLSVDEDSKTILEIKEGTKVSDIKQKIVSNGNIEFIDAKGNLLEDSSIVTTETKLKVSLSDKLYEYKIIVPGDVNGDGKVNIADVVKIADHTISKNILNDYEKKAAEVTSDKNINIADVVKIADYTLDKSLVLTKVWPITGVELDKTTISLQPTETATLKAKVLPSTATDKTVTWTSSNTSVATVSNGVVTAVGNGTATITATTANGKTATTTVNVTTNVTGISVSPTSLSLQTNGTSSATITATVSPTNASNKTITWTSSNTSIATVSNGVVTAVGNGTATITATTANGKTATTTVNVTTNVTGLSVNTTSLSLQTNGTSSATITATVSPTNASNKTITWTSSNTSIATVSNSGVVTAKGNGTATITAKTANGRTATTTVNVTTNVTGISVSKASVNMVPFGLTETIVSTVSPANASNKTVTWISSNTNVATVSNGVVTAKALGTATITARTANGRTATTTVSVKDKYEVLLIGNSKTFREDLPEKFYGFVRNAGIGINYTGENYNYFSDTGGKNLLEVYNSKKSTIEKYYDIIVLQEQTTEYKASDCTTGNYNNGVSKIVSAVKAKNPNVHIYLRKVWVKETSDTATIQQGYNCTTSIASTYGLTVINDGPAMYAAKAGGRGVFVSANGSTEQGQHQNKHGALLSAACIFATIFGRDPTTNVYKSGLSNDSLIRQYAKQYCY